MKCLALTALAALALTLGPIVQAQTDEPTVDPAAIFADGVVWTLLEPTPSLQARTRLNRQNQSIDVFDGEVWRTFPFPPQVDSVSTARMRDDGMIVFSMLSPDDLSQDTTIPPHAIWLLDPHTGTYTRPPTVCDGQVLAAMPGEAGEWVVLETEGAALLCHSGTGQMHDVLCDGLDEWRVFPAPDDNYLLLAARDIHGSGDFLIFSHDLRTEDLVLLGEVSRGLERGVWVCSWLNATRGALCVGSSRSWLGTGYYAFDVTQEGSLVRAFGGTLDNTIVLDNPPRYVSLFAPDYDAPVTGNRSSSPCMLTVYDAEQLFDLELGADCLTLRLGQGDRDIAPIAPYFRQGDVIYYATRASETATLATLYSYNLQTLTQKQIVPAEIEIANILGVSPDGRYIVLLMGHQDDYPGEGSVAIMRLEDGEFDNFVYFSEPLGVQASDQVLWLDEQSVVIAAFARTEQVRVAEDGSTVPERVPPTVRRLTFNDDGSVDLVMTMDNQLDFHNQFPLNTSANNRYWLREDNTVLDLFDFQTVQILREEVAESYEVYQMQWSPDGNLIVPVLVSDTFYRYSIALDS